MIAADSNSVNGFPPCPSGSTIAGMRWLGVIFKNSGLNWSPAPILTGMTLYSRPSSSSAICTLCPFGVGQLHTSIIVFSHCTVLGEQCHSVSCCAIQDVVISLDQARLKSHISHATEPPMPSRINVAEAKAKLSELLDRALAGEEILIARAGKPIAQLVPIRPREARKPGAWRGWEADLSAENLLAPMDPEDLDAAEGKF